MTERSDMIGGRMLRRARTLGGDVVSAPRLLLAAKAAIAATVAWFLVPFVPFLSAEYAYYAPLGVLMSMYPTILDSARSGLQVLLGTALGVAVGLGGLAIVSAGLHGAVAVAAVVTVGVALGGVRQLGAGRELVAVAGVFVLLIGGQQADTYSFMYLATLGFGIVVGAIVNVVVVPPLYLRRAGRRLTTLRAALASRLDAMADSLEGTPLDYDDLDRSMSDLVSTVGAVSADVDQAARSARGNPRGRLHADERDENARQLHALQYAAFYTRDLADVLARLADEPRSDDDTVRPRLAAAVRACGELVAAPVTRDDPDERLQRANDALDACTRAIDERDDLNPSGLAAHIAAAVCVRRIIESTRPLG